MMGDNYQETPNEALQQLFNQSVVYAAIIVNVEELIEYFLAVQHFKQICLLFGCAYFKIYMIRNP